MRADDDAVPTSVETSNPPPAGSPPDASIVPPAPASGPDASSPTSTCAAGPQPISLPSADAGGIHLSICSDVSGVSCPEITAIVAKQEVRFVRDAYESAKRRGNAGLLGNFGVSSYLGEMLRIAIKLAGFRDVYADLIPFSAYS
jgi:hypothetical protein